ncbi:MAG: sensor histidine kinase [Rhodospirillaceae bacterium]|jgi:signal transduction histidine kinase|nr:sensor histidine kinase [Rhodospirillaceae bacterium]MBT4486591.1 sensor histidine kinase [Rhodospirillaceae bacterium]MBT5195798.1 sensor histidine kinase [Rhodospirillaceae bacterium]MBT5895487.1 sensor histidine kinase [Rhodospirillaceae bacterium]MBT6428259.1 sensor histidine kinase [Rhodospirillaceae bacterium]
MPAKGGSLRLRLIAMAALWCAVALIAAWAVLSALFADQVRRGFDGNLAAQLEGVIAASEWRDEGGPSLRRPLPDPRFQQPLSGWYWQISGPDGPVLRSRSLWDGTLPATESSPAGGGISYDDVAGPNGAGLRLAARSLTLTGVEGAFLFQLAGDSAAVAADIARFDRLLAVALAILGLGLIAAMVLQVQIGLRPLARIGRALGDIRAGRADRLQGAFPSEIQPLADEIDTLLGHQAAVISRARAHAGDLAHALKTPLAVLTNEADQNKGALARHVRHQVVEMRRQVDRHLSRARTAAAAGVLGARCDITPVLEGLVRVLNRLHQERGVTINLDVADHLAFAGEEEDLQEMLGNLLENACQWAKSSIMVTATAQENGVLFAIDDDGPGLPPAQREEVLNRGARLDESKPGSGLGLAIVADMAALYQGELSLRDAAMGGLSARLTLPLAP